MLDSQIQMLVSLLHNFIMTRDSTLGSAIMPILASSPFLSLHVLYYQFINMKSMANSAVTHSSTRHRKELTT